MRAESHPPEDTMAEQKSAYRQMADALGRAKKTAGELKERGEMLMGEGMRTVVSGTTSFGAGLVDQRFGAVDAATGIRVHKVNGAPSALLAAGALKGAAAFGVFGKFEVAGFAAGDGAWNHSAGTWGRMAGERLRRKAEAAGSKTDAPKDAAKEAAKTDAKQSEKAAVAQ